MAITKKPTASNAALAVDVEALIEKGGSVPRQSSKRHQVYVQLRLSPEVLGKIDRCLEARLVKTPRHTWLLEAIHEKLKTGR